jgi:ring-1,2-phenylacetyl-CoA epoxidase subunit PaaB
MTTDGTTTDGTTTDGTTTDGTTTDGTTTDGTTTGAGRQPRSDWPLYEVFLRSKRGLNHVHVGSLHAADAQMALHHARDLYTRRNEGVSIWVAAAADITASSPDEKDPFFAPSGDKVYRHPTFYDIPDSVPHI